MKHEGIIITLIMSVICSIGALMGWTAYFLDAILLGEAVMLTAIGLASWVAFFDLKNR